MEERREGEGGDEGGRWRREGREAFVLLLSLLNLTLLIGAQKAVAGL